MVYSNILKLYHDWEKTNWDSQTTPWRGGPNKNCFKPCTHFSLSSAVSVARWYLHPVARIWNANLLALASLSSTCSTSVEVIGLWMYFHSNKTLFLCWLSMHANQEKVIKFYVGCIRSLDWELCRLDYLTALNIWIYLRNMRSCAIALFNHFHVRGHSLHAGWVLSG
jgi:hypothetical protein